MVGLGRIRRLCYALAQLGNGLFRLPTRKEDAAALNPCHNVLGSHPQNFLVEGRSFRDAAGLKIYLHHAVLQVRVFGGSREAPAILGQGAVGILVLHVEVAQRKRNRGALVLWDPQHQRAAVALALGDFYVQHQDADRALAEYRRGLSAAPEDSDLKNRMVEVYLETSRIPEATALNQEILRVRPKDVVARVQRGRILLSSEKTEEAISELRQRVAEAPDSAQAHHYLGIAYWQSGEVAQAQSELQEALKAWSDTLPTLRSLAQLHLAQGNVKLPKEDTLRGLQLWPTDTAGHLLLGTILFQNAKFSSPPEQFGFY